MITNTCLRSIVTQQIEHVPPSLPGGRREAPREHLSEIRQWPREPLLA
jgi:hypothetical protein